MSHKPQLRLNYARDRLLLQLCATLRHVGFDCSPTGKALLCEELEATEIVFKRRLDELFPEGPDTDS